MVSRPTCPDCGGPTHPHCSDNAVTPSVGCDLWYCARCRMYGNPTVGRWVAISPTQLVDGE